VKVDGDDSAWHFGVYENEMLIAVISLFDDGDGSMRFRKFATLPKFQNLGYGSQLLTFAINFAKNEGFKRLWCDARTDAFGFYRRFGFVRFSEVFLKEDIEYYKIEKTL
jgi:predicted GNAT family N-acyltransferase